MTWCNRKKAYFHWKYFCSFHLFCQRLKKQLWWLGLPLQAWVFWYWRISVQKLLIRWRLGMKQGGVKYGKNLWGGCCVPALCVWLGNTCKAEQREELSFLPLMGGLRDGAVNCSRDSTVDFPFESVLRDNFPSPDPWWHEGLKSMCVTYSPSKSSYPEEIFPGVSIKILEKKRRSLLAQVHKIS